jgi:hypothetical protein
MYTIARVSSWDLEGCWKYYSRGWESSLHRLCSRTGSFPPAMAHYYISKYTEPGWLVLDPFAGKGTAPLEACLNGRIGIGNDLAPEAFVLTHAKVRPATYGEVEDWVRRNRASIAMGVDPDAPEEVQAFYHRSTLRQLMALRELLMRDDTRLGIFLKGLVLGILHGSSSCSLSVKCSHSFSMSPGYVARSRRRLGLSKPRRDVSRCILERAASILSGRLPVVEGQAYNCDARSLPLPSSIADFIITSPPYLNMQTYAWDNWLRLWFLGYDYREVGRRLFHSQSLSRFAEFMEQSLREMYRLLKRDRACVIVLGIVKKRGVLIDLAEFVRPIAERVGFNVRRVVYDNIPKESKYLMYIGDKQGVSREAVLELEKGEASERPVHTPLKTRQLSGRMVTA